MIEMYYIYPCSPGKWGVFSTWSDSHPDFRAESTLLCLIIFLSPWPWTRDSPCSRAPASSCQRRNRPTACSPSTGFGTLNVLLLVTMNSSQVHTLRSMLLSEFFELLGSYLAPVMGSGRSTNCIKYPFKLLINIEQLWSSYIKFEKTYLSQKNVLNEEEKTIRLDDD